MKTTYGKKGKNPQPAKAIAIYLRTSSFEAQAPERSQAGQLRLIEERILKNYDLPVYKTYSDDESGQTEQRAGYQAMLQDAHAGKFSIIAVSSLDRFGRKILISVATIEELRQLGVKVIAASSPDRDTEYSLERFQMNLELALAQLESERTGERTRAAMVTRYMEGEWPHVAPDGYINKEIRTYAIPEEEQRKYARYKRWIERDPEQSHVIRLAFDLLLEDRLTLAEICHELDRRGYHLKRGTRFVMQTDGEWKANISALSRIYHNWFYAGWVVVNNRNCQLKPRQVRGKWEEIVSTEEFEQAQAILERRIENRMPRKKNFYLLQGLVHLETHKEGEVENSDLEAPDDVDDLDEESNNAEAL